MGLFRRRSQKASEDGQKTTIEEVQDSDQTPNSTSQPVIEEPDEQGNYPARGTSRHSEQEYVHSHGSPFDAFFSHPMMDGFGGMGPMGPFGQTPSGRGPFDRDPFFQDPFSMHRQLFNMGPSVFANDPFMDRPFGMIAGPDRFQRQGSQNSRDAPPQQSQRSSETQTQRQPSGDQFAYEFKSWSSTGTGANDRYERLFSAHGSTDDNHHHVHESVRGRDGRIQSRQESIPFGQRNAKEQRPAIMN